MSDFIVQKITNHSMNQRRISFDLHCACAVEADLQSVIGHRGAVHVDHGPKQRVQVNLTSRKSQCIRFCFGKVQRLIQKIGEAVHFLDDGNDRLDLLAVSGRRQQHFELSSDCCQRAA